MPSATGGLILEAFLVDGFTVYVIRHVIFRFPFVDVIHPQSNKFVTGVRVKVTGDSKLNDLLLSDL